MQRRDRGRGRRVSCGASLLGLAMAAALAGCASQAAVDTTSPLHVVTADRALAMPDPGGPEIVSVTEQAYANAVEQHLYLSTDAATPGQNVLRVQLFGPMDRKGAGRSSLRPGYLSDEESLGAEMRAGLPGIPMRRSPLFVQNRYGPFGYALGQARGEDRCIYAWQRIHASGAQSLWRGNKGSVRVNLRFCDARMSERQLVALMDGFSIDGFFRDAAWNPLGPAEGPPAGLGRPGHETPVFEDEVAAPVQRRAASGPRRTRSVMISEAAAPPPQLPSPIGARVPAPPGAGALGGVPAPAPGLAAVAPPPTTEAAPPAKVASTVRVPSPPTLPQPSSGR